jgi:hypothetical protein
MRLIAFIAAALVASSPVAAQEWQEYVYPDHAFTVVFPAKPQIETTTYQIADNRAVPARVYSARENNATFTVTVAEIGDTGLDENAVIDSTIKRLSAGAAVKVNMPTVSTESTAVSSASSVPTAVARWRRYSITISGFI